MKKLINKTKILLCLIFSFVFLFGGFFSSINEIYIYSNSSDNKNNDETAKTTNMSMAACIPSDNSEMQFNSERNYKSNNLNLNFFINNNISSISIFFKILKNISIITFLMFCFIWIMIFQKKSDGKK